MKLQYPGSLHGHTEYSNARLRDSINKHEDLINYAISLGHEVIAITEHDCVSDAIKIEKYYNKIKENNPNFKVILGNEIYLVRDGLDASNCVAGKDKFYHFILLARDAEGHRQIRELSTRAWTRSFSWRGQTRVPTYYSDLVEIVGSNPGHVIASSACLGGFLDNKLLEYASSKDETLYENIKNWCFKIESIFGKGNFYLELQPSKSNEQRVANELLVKLSKDINFKYIITCDEHYLKKEDAPIHAAYLNSQDGEREVDAFYATTYLMDTNELESFMELSNDELREAYKAIIEIKNKCEDYSLLKPLNIPTLRWKEQPFISPEEKALYIKKIPMLQTFEDSDYIGDKVLVDAIINGIKTHEDLQNERAYKEINSNLEMTWVSSNINKAHWSAYFLNLQNIIDECWKAGTLVGPGRGSGVGFLLLYVLDIIQINCLREKTRCFSWRFLNPDRVSVLDVDVDIEGGRRAEVLEHLRQVYGEDRVSNVVTFGTEKSKAAIKTAARGLGIEVEEAQYLASLIPEERGQTWTLKETFYGDEEKGYKPVKTFVQLMENEYKELWNVAQKIEGLVGQIGEHAGGVIFVDEPFYNSTALMRVPNGDLVTQFDLHDAESVSLIKYDLLSVKGFDKIHVCIDLLCDSGYITKEPTLKETYEKTIGIYNLERDNQDMWKMIWENKIFSLFQMDEQSGIKGIATLKPTSIDDLAILNSTIRLMAQEKGGEMPTDKLARFKRNPIEWDKEMQKYGVDRKYKAILEPILGISYGLCIAQEQFMELVQLPELGGFSLTWADRLRKSIAKKNPKDYATLTEEFYAEIEKKHIDSALAKYVWSVLVAMSRGYGFNQSHTLAYSLVALQEMNLCFKYPIIFWNCACLITDSGGAEKEKEPEEKEVVSIYEKEDFENYEYVDAPDRKTKLKKKRAKSADYGSIATAIGKMSLNGIKIAPPDINKSKYTFSPDVENNQIIFGLRGLKNIGEDIVNDIMSNRPYASIKDFYTRVKPKHQVMESLIKCGAFDAYEDRQFAMGWFIWETCDKKKNVTLQNMSALKKYGMLPQDEASIIAAKVYEFNRYLKQCCKYNVSHYKLDDRGIDFLAKINAEDLIIQGTYLDAKVWDKVYQKYMDTFRAWIASDKQNIIDELNSRIFNEAWNDYAKGTISSWEMESMCYYYHEHELNNVNNSKYNFADFSKLPEIPIIDKSFKKGDKVINMYKLNKICGTCIDKNKNKSTITLLTTTGVVTVKFAKNYFALFDKRISEKQPDGTKKIKEYSWFDRGSMIVIQGIRIDNQFVPKKYASTPGHQLYKIDEILPNGDLVLRSERYQGDEEE